MRGGGGDGSSGRGSDASPRDIGAVVPLRIIAGAGGGLLRGGNPCADCELSHWRLFLALRCAVHRGSPLLPEANSGSKPEDRAGIPGLQCDFAVRQVRPLHGEPGHLPGAGGRGERARHRPRHYAGPSVAWPLPHPRFSPWPQDPVHPHNRGRLIPRAPRRHRPTALRLRRRSRACLRVPPLGGQDRSHHRPLGVPLAALRLQARGDGGELDAPLPVRRDRVGPRCCAASPGAPTEAGCDSGAGPDARWRVPAAVRGGTALLLSDVRRPGGGRGGGGGLRGGGTVPGGAAVVGDRDQEHCGGGRPEADRRGEDREVEREAGARRVSYGEPSGRAGGGAGWPSPGHASLQGVHPGGGRRLPQAGLEGSFAAHRLRMAAPPGGGNAVIRHGGAHLQRFFSLLILRYLPYFLSFLCCCTSRLPSTGPAVSSISSSPPPSSAQAFALPAFPIPRSRHQDQNRRPWNLSDPSAHVGARVEESAGHPSILHTESCIWVALTSIAAKNVPRPVLCSAQSCSTPDCLPQSAPRYHRPLIYPSAVELSPFIPIGAVPHPPASCSAR